MTTPPNPLPDDPTLPPPRCLRPPLALGPAKNSWNGARVAVVVLFAACALVFARWVVFVSSPDSLVVYCAHDAEYSEEILREFTRQTGIPVSIRFDTEATKSLGLANLLRQEKDQPRCDVFWNNQVLTTMDLAEEGLLQPYQGPGFTRIRAAYKAPDGEWTGFAARMRVVIVNTKKRELDEESLPDALKGDLSRMAIAKPLYGTTLTHYTVLWKLWGPERLKKWHRDLRRRGIREVDGNGTVKNVVAEGACDFGFTDNDDFFVAKDAGKPVAMLPVRVEGGRTICIPNSVAIVRGTKRMVQAQQLVDYLLSEETELALAASTARQIPLGPVNEAKLSDEVKSLAAWAKDGFDLRLLGPAHRECLAWLKSEYLR